MGEYGVVFSQMHIKYLEWASCSCEALLKQRYIFPHSFLRIKFDLIYLLSPAHETLFESGNNILRNSPKNNIYVAGKAGNYPELEQPLAKDEIKIYIYQGARFVFTAF